MSPATWQHPHLGALQVDDDGVATLTLAGPDGVNRIGAAFVSALVQALNALSATPNLSGLLVVSAHADLCVGADLDALLGTTDRAGLYALTRSLTGVLRRLETLGVPVAVVIAGAALGGGYELALACHHRIAVDTGRVQVGLPELGLGLIPGGGGTQRLLRLLGPQRALELMSTGKVLRAPDALDAGLVDAVASDASVAIDQARAWLRDHSDARQPWDTKGWRMPGPRAGSGELAQLFVGAAAQIIAKTAGSLPAAQTLLTVVQEGCRLPLDAAIAVEGRHFAALATSPQAQAMARTLWSSRRAVARLDGLDVAADAAIRRVGVVGAGLMGAGLAGLFARAGYDVVLEDVDDGAVQRGIERVHASTDAAWKRRSQADRDAAVARVTGATTVSALAGCDLVIEAVFEDLELKRRVLADIAAVVGPDALLASNTSALPIAALTAAVPRPERVLGLHFFSPVERMPLVEVVRGPNTAETTLSRALSAMRALERLPIVVGDGYGFFTTRLFSAYILEGARLVAEGHAPAAVEWGARSVGMPVGPLQVFDEVGVALGYKAALGATVFTGVDAASDPGVQLVGELVAAGRTGRAAGAGFYDYAEGKRRGLWRGLHRDTRAPLAQKLGRRLLLAQVAEVGRAMDDGVITRPQDIDVAAVFGVGFAPCTGGPLAWVDQVGAERIVAELRAMEQRYGERFAPSRALLKAAAEGARFYLP